MRLRSNLIYRGKEGDPSSELEKLQGDQTAMEEHEEKENVLWENKKNILAIIIIAGILYALWSFYQSPLGQDLKKIFGDAAGLLAWALANPIKCVFLLLVAYPALKAFMGFAGGEMADKFKRRLNGAKDSYARLEDLEKQIADAKGDVEKQKILTKNRDNEIRRLTQIEKMDLNKIDEAKMEKYKEAFDKRYEQLKGEGKQIFYEEDTGMPTDEPKKNGKDNSEKPTFPPDIKKV